MAYQITFDRPSMRYDEGLPIGNGRLGGMVMGGVGEKRIYLNEETVWYGGPRDRVNPDALKSMPEIRRLMREGRIQEAERLALLSLTGTPESQRHFTTLGMITMDFFRHPDRDAENYSNTLDFDTATVIQRYQLHGVNYQMKVLASIPHQVIAIQIRADRPSLHFYAGIERGERVAQFSYGTHEDDSRKVKDIGVMVNGNLGGHKGLNFAMTLAGRSDGQFRLIGDKIDIQNASVAELYLAGGTDFSGEDPEKLTLDRVEQALKDGFDAVESQHLDQWHSLYGLAGVSVNDSQLHERFPSMNRLFDAFHKDDLSDIGVYSQEDLDALNDELVMRLFHFGRYVLLASSYDSLLPAPLQGLWCRDLLSIWDGKYTTNINLQMAYWPVDSANLPGCFDGYLRLAERVRETGLETARRMYGCRGFVLHNNTDLWADTAVQDAGTHCSYWFDGGFWIAADLWEHYLYTADPEYLRRAWPILRDAAMFALDFMEEDEQGHLVMGVSSSPENFYYDNSGNAVSFCRMTAMDSQLIGLNLRNCETALRLLPDLERDADFEDRVRDAAERLFPTQIGTDGVILEWGEPHPAAEKAHRHQSHVIGAYPYDAITQRTPALFEAVGKTIDHRRADGGCNTGWSRAWAGGLYARLGRGDDARDMVGTMARYSGQPNLFSCCNIGRTPKLMEDSMPMQIDGNMGTVQAVIEMLLQSHDGEIRLLPALPSSWRKGSFFGFVARGNVVVDADWADGKLNSCTLHPRVDGEITLRAGCRVRLSSAGLLLTSDSEGVIRFRALANEIYRIERAESC